MVRPFDNVKIRLLCLHIDSYTQGQGSSGIMDDKEAGYVDRTLVRSGTPKDRGAGLCGHHVEAVADVRRQLRILRPIAEQLAAPVSGIEH